MGGGGVIVFGDVGCLGFFWFVEVLGFCSGVWDGVRFRE